MQNYPYIMPMYQPQGYRYQQPPVMQPQANVDWVQVAGFEAAKAQQVEPGKTCWMRDTSEPYIYAKAVETPEQLKRAKDMRTWANIIGRKV